MQLKTILTLISAFLLSIKLYGCKDSVVTPQGDERGYLVEGQIHNWSYGTNALIKMERYYLSSPSVLDSIVLSVGSIDSTGTFNFPLPNPPEYLLETSLMSAFSYSDTTSRFYLFSSFTVYKNLVRVGSITCSEKEYDTSYSWGNYSIAYLYSTKGLVARKRDTSFVSQPITTYDYNLAINPGWNQIVFRYATSADSIRNIEASIDARFKGNWYYIAF